ncbi:hypothetical protein [Pseudomonas sp. KK4]|uniref:hypothetical protein n=1 Tax=Pseudomonas sp. KK4 TaxID=1855729 RepID=UPI00097C7696|nr:hypothetical protein [Pseudomonas sp. KK4]
MTIDKQKLQKLLWSEVASWKADCAEWKQNAEALGDFLGEKTVEEVALELLAENERLRTLRSTTERDLAQELEVWKHGPSCWNCGDTGDVYDMVGEWRGQCDCNAAKLIDVSSERDQLKAENEALRKALSDLVSGDVGQSVQWNLSSGQGAETADGKAWLAAAAMGKGEQL